MKKTIVWGLLMVPWLAAAQGMADMDEAAMQQMMEQAEKMQNCMASVDQTEMDAFQQRAEQMEAEVDALCAAGKRDAAEARAMSFGKEMASNNAVQQMQKCGEGMMKTMPKVARTASEESDGEPGHICDEK